MISGETQEARIFCVLNNRTKYNLFPIIQNNVLTSIDEDENISLDSSVKTRIFLIVIAPIKLTILNV